MSQRIESHIFPAVVGIIGVAAFLVLVYLLLSLGFGFIDRLFNWSSSGTPIAAALTRLLSARVP